MAWSHRKIRQEKLECLNKMAITEKGILKRLYLVAGGLFVFAVGVMVKLVMVQQTDAGKYRELLESKVKTVEIQPNRGNLYADDGSILAISVTKYELRFDPVSASTKDFNALIEPLSDSLSIYFGKPSNYYIKKFRNGRKKNKRHILVGRNLDYLACTRIRNFPLFNLGQFRGGLKILQRSKRDYPIGKIAQRSVGYERVDENGYYTRVGLEGAFGKHLRGKAGSRLIQELPNKNWKPITDYNQIEPQDGYDVVSTINLNIQDIAHHSLLKQLERFKADHGCVVVMEVKTGEVKAISNLGRTKEGKYYEKRNYAVWESHEPGSTFKLASLMVALEDKVVDTSTVVDTKKGVLTFYKKYRVEDSKWGGYGKISLAKAFEVSSNTGVVQVIDNHYRDRPEKFVNRLYSLGLQDPLNLSITGEGEPVIPHPNDDTWSGIALPWMAYGYGVSFTPLQTLTLYNAIANDGEMVKPRLIREVRAWDQTVKRFDKEVLHPSICSPETVNKLKQMLKNVVEKKHGTGHDLYSPDFSMAGKTGTCQKNYASKDPDKLQYISSFAGYFPADNPKYSCIVVIHEPDKKEGYYGADVSGPVFRTIAQKIYANSPMIYEIKSIEPEYVEVAKDFAGYMDKMSKEYKRLPKVKGMSGMDALALLENHGYRVELKGTGKVVRVQEIGAKKIVLQLA